MSQTPRDLLVREFVDSLTAGSLQSPQELIRATNALGLSDADIDVDQNRLRCIFEIRNQTIHDLDINFEAPTRHRRSRKRQHMIDHSNYLLEYAEAVLQAVSAKMVQSPSGPRLSRGQVD